MNLMSPMKINIFSEKLTIDARHMLVVTDFRMARKILLMFIKRQFCV